MPNQTLGHKKHAELLATLADSIEAQAKAVAQFYRMVSTTNPYWPAHFDVTRVTTRIDAIEHDLVALKREIVYEENAR